MAKTEAFLDRRLSEIAKIPKFTSPVNKLPHRPPHWLALLCLASCAGNAPFKSITTPISSKVVLLRAASLLIAAICYNDNDLSFVIGLNG